MKTHKEFADYIAKIAPIMRLGHWTFIVDETSPADPDCWMSIRCYEYSFGATVKISPDLFKESIEIQRECVVHELVHCHLAHGYNIVRTEIGGRLEKLWTMAHEHGVQAIAKVIAPSIPLPDQTESAS